MQELIIKQINNKWTINKRELSEMSEIEKNILSKFLTNKNESIN